MFPNSEHVDLRAEALSDGPAGRQLTIRGAHSVLATGIPLHHEKYGNGWEITPNPQLDLSAAERDTVPHRVFFKNYDMMVFKKNAAGGWDAVGDYLPAFERDRGLGNIFDIDAGHFEGKGQALAHALENVDPALASKILEGYGTRSKKFELKVLDFTAKEPGRAVDLSKYGYANYVYDLSHGGTLYINASAISSSRAGLRSVLNGKSGAEWNRHILENALRLRLQVASRELGKANPLRGDPAPEDGLYGRNRDYDYDPASLRTKRADNDWLAPPPAVPAVLMAGFGKTLEWEGKYRYGAFSTMVANAVMADRFGHLICDLQGYAEKNSIARAEIDANVRAYFRHYNNLSHTEVAAIVEHGLNDATQSVYEEEQSVFQEGFQNVAFIRGVMELRPDLAPTDHRLRDWKDNRTLEANGEFSEPPFQIQCHRGNYNNAYGIPQNCLAAFVTAYAAGIRCVEVDVLETGGENGQSGSPDSPMRENQAAELGTDNDVVIVHDLTSNRTNAAYGDALLHHIEESKTQSFKDLMRHQVIDPTSPTPRLDRAGFCGEILPQTLKSLLDFINKHANDACVILDARNDSPIGAAKLLADQRRKVDPHGTALDPRQLPMSYDDNVMVKIYPYTLRDGYGAMLQRYAARYTEGDLATAAEDLRHLNVVPVLEGGPGQASPELQKASQLRPEHVLSVLPVSFWGVHLDASARLRIASGAHAKLQFAHSFFGKTNISGVQLPPTPSDDTWREALHGDYISYFAEGYAVQAAIQSFRTTPHQLPPELDLWSWQRLGTSDRFPDLYVAARSPDDRVIDTPGQIKRYNYNAREAHPNLAVSYGEVMRSSLGAAPLAPGGPVLDYSANGNISFATTDGSTDLLAALARVLGQAGTPITVRHHPQNVLKEARPGVRLAPDVATFEPPAWLSEFSNRLLFRGKVNGDVPGNSHPFRRHEYLQFRRRVANVRTNSHEREDSHNWLNSWSSGTEFALHVRSKFLGKELLRFSGNRGVLLPFAGPRAVTDRHGRALDCGYFSFSPERGLTIYGVDASFNFWRAQPDHDTEAGQYTFEPWVPGRELAPNIHGQNEEQELRTIMLRGTPNVRDAELLHMFNDLDRTSVIEDDRRTADQIAAADARAAECCLPGNQPSTSGTGTGLEDMDTEGLDLSAAAFVNPPGPNLGLPQLLGADMETWLADIEGLAKDTDAENHQAAAKLLQSMPMIYPHLPVAEWVQADVPPAFGLALAPILTVALTQGRP